MGRISSVVAAIGRLFHARRRVLNCFRHACARVEDHGAVLSSTFTTRNIRFHATHPPRGIPLNNLGACHGVEHHCAVLVCALAASISADELDAIAQQAAELDIWQEAADLLDELTAAGWKTTISNKLKTVFYSKFWIETSATHAERVIYNWEHDRAIKNEADRSPDIS